MTKTLEFLLLVGLASGSAMAADLDAIEPIHMPAKGQGWAVSGGVVQDHSGNLYGLVKNSNRGEIINRLERGCGMVFRIDTKGVRTTLHDFSGHKRSRGCRVHGSLLVHDGFLYGLTLAGGRGDHGTLFRLSAGQGHQLLHRFGGADGSMPVGGLTLAADGNLYGITTAGGIHDAGTVFRITPSGHFESLHSFDPNGSVGSRPNWRLTAGSDGALYGVAYSNGGDTVYRVGLDGVVSLLKRLRYADGCLPEALTLGSDGWLYGAALICGTYNKGTLYRIRPDGSFERLHAFKGTEVGHPKESLSEGPDGTWYGVTIGDEGSPPKTVYKIRFDGSAPVPLHVFDRSRWRGDPSGPLLLAPDGLLYGTSATGGNAKGPDGLGSGMVFRLAP